MDDNTKKEEFSYGYIQAIAATSGFSTELKNRGLDYAGIDLTLIAPKDIDSLLSPRIDIQVKCTASTKIIHDDYIHFPLPIKNYNRLRQKSMVPQILIVVIVASNINEWARIKGQQTILESCAYWISLEGYEETKNTKTITIKIPKINKFTPDSLTEMMKNITHEYNELLKLKKILKERGEL